MSIPLRGPIKAGIKPAHILLARALIAIQFSPVFKIADVSGAGIATFQDAVRKDYPTVRYEIEKSIQLNVVDSEIKPNIQEHPVWRFLDTEEKWRVSLTRETISIETTEGYQTRQDFRSRMQTLVASVAEHFQPAQATRVGVRYLNTADSRRFKKIFKTCRTELIPFGKEDDLVQSNSFWRFDCDEGNVLLRAGIIPIGETHDPAFLDPVEGQTWVLDIDVVKRDALDFNADSLFGHIDAQVERAHAIFSWAIPA